MDFTRADDGQDTAPVNIMEIPTPQSCKRDLGSPTTQTAEELRHSYQKCRQDDKASEALTTVPRICPPSPRYNPYPTEDKDATARSSDEPCFTPDKKASGFNIFKCLRSQL